MVFRVLDKLEFGLYGEGTLNACPSIHGFRVLDKLEFGLYGEGNTERLAKYSWF